MRGQKERQPQQESRSERQRDRSGQKSGPVSGATYKEAREEGKFREGDARRHSARTRNAQKGRIEILGRGNSYQVAASFVGNLRSTSHAKAAPVGPNQEKL